MFPELIYASGLSCLAASAAYILEDVYRSPKTTYFLSSISDARLKNKTTSKLKLSVDEAVSYLVKHHDFVEWRAQEAIEADGWHTQWLVANKYEYQVFTKYTNGKLKIVDLKD